MELLITLGLFVLHFIINTLAWAWVGMSLGSGALVAYEMFGGSIKDASAAIKSSTQDAAVSQPA